MAVADIPADQIVNERSSYEQYLWKLAGSPFYRWDDRTDYMYRIGASPVPGQGLPPGPPVPPIPAPFSRAQTVYLDGRYVRSVNGLPVDANGNIDVPIVDQTARDAASGAAASAVTAFNASADLRSGNRLSTFGHDVSNADMNTIVTDGFHRGSGMTNAPTVTTPQEWFYLFVESHDGENWVKQTATGYGVFDNLNVGTWYRVRRGGVWNAWVKIADPVGAVDTTLRTALTPYDRLGVISKNLSGTDLNNWKLNGWGAGNNLTNSPDGSTAFFYVRNHANTAADNYFQQTAVKYAQGGNSGDTWVRYAEGTGTYTPWIRIADPQGAVDNGGRAILAGKVGTATAITAGTGLTGGGDLTTSRTLALSGGSIASLAKADTASQPGHTHTAAQISDATTTGRALVTAADQASARNALAAASWSTGVIAGTGLSGGGDLTTSRTISLSAATQASLAKADSAYQKPATNIPDADLASKFVKTVNNVTPDAAGNVAVAGGGSGGAVSSVNTKTGAVVLNATDVGAAAQRTILGSNSATWTRILTIDGKSSTEGANVELLISGLGVYGTAGRATVLVQFAQRNSWTPVAKAWKWGANSDADAGALMFSQISEFVTELWYSGPAYTFDSSVTILSGHNYTMSLAQQAGSPTTPVLVPYIPMDNPVRSVNGVGPDANGNVASDFGHVQDVRYVAYGHSFGQVQTPIQNTTAAGVYPNRVLELLKADPALFQNLTQSGSRTAGILTQVKATWTQGNYGVVTLLCNQNDVGDRTAQATFKANVKAIIDYLRGPGFSPTIVVVLDTTCTALGYARYASPPTDADVANYNQYLRDVVAGYPSDGSIVIADPYTGWNPATMTGPDGQHPNDRGQAYIAHSIRVALASTTYREGLNVGFVPPATMFYDSFNRANSASTLGTAMYGTPWSVLGTATYGTIGNRAYRSDAGSVTESAAVVDLGKANVDLSVTMDAITLKGSGPVWHASDLNNMWVVDIIGTGVGNAKVYKKVAGTFTQVGSALTVEVKTSSVVRVLHPTSGALSVTVDGVQAFSATDTFNNTATKHGFRITDLSSNANRINDVVIR